MQIYGTNHNNRKEEMKLHEHYTMEVSGWQQ